MSPEVMLTRVEVELPDGFEALQAEARAEDYRMLDCRV
jgi:hypothetical protein